MSFESENVVFDPAGDLILLGEIVKVAVPEDAIMNDDSNKDNMAPTVNDDLVAGSPLEDLQAGGGIASLAGEHLISPPPRTVSQDMKMRVSSKHLVLASEYFAGMIGVNEPNTLTYEAASEISVRGDNVEALQILLNIVHHSTRKVPRDVDLRLLCEIVVLIDKYELHEAAELFTDTWYATLRLTMPQGASNDLGVWIYVCYELDQPADFSVVTRTAILDTNCVFPPAQEARIPHWFIRSMELARLEAVGKILSSVSEMIEIYAQSDLKCWRVDYVCDALSLGSFIRELKRIGLYPVPDPASWTRPISDLLGELRELQVTTSCSTSTSREEYDSCKRARKFIHSNRADDFSWDTPVEVYDPEPKHLDEILRDTLSRIEDGICGLNLKRT